MSDRIPMTIRGAELLREELKRLKQVERPAVRCGQARRARLDADLQRVAAP